MISRGAKSSVLLAAKTRRRKSIEEYDGVPATGCAGSNENPQVERLRSAADTSHSGLPLTLTVVAEIAAVW